MTAVFWSVPVVTLTWQGKENDWFLDYFIIWRNNFAVSGFRGGGELYGSAP